MLNKRSKRKLSTHDSVIQQHCLSPMAIPAMKTLTASTKPYNSIKSRQRS